MVILLYGLDSYRRLKRLKEYIEAHFQESSNSTLGRFDFGNLRKEEVEQEFLKLKEFAVGRSLFGGRNLAILQEIWDSGLSDFRKFLKPYFGSNDFKIIISEEEAPPANLKSIAQKADVKEEFEELSSQKLKAFIKEEARARGLNLGSTALDFLVEEFEGNSWGVITELGKLCSLLKAVKGEILEIKDIQEAGDYVTPENLFSFINALTYRQNLPKKLVILERLFFGREEPAKIFNILASRSFFPVEFLRKLADYDVAVKSGKMDYEEVLLDLALS